MPVEDFCIPDSEDEDNAIPPAFQTNNSLIGGASGKSMDKQLTGTGDSTIQTFTIPAGTATYSTSISSFTAAVAQNTSTNVDTSQISSSSSRDAGSRHVRLLPQEPLDLTATKPKKKRPKPRPRIVPISPSLLPHQITEATHRPQTAQLDMTIVSKSRKRSRVIPSSRPPSPAMAQNSEKSVESVPILNQKPGPSESRKDPPLDELGGITSPIHQAFPSRTVEESSPSPPISRKRKRKTVIDASEEEENLGIGVTSTKGAEKENTHPSMNSTASSTMKRKKQVSTVNDSSPPTSGRIDEADELNLTHEPASYDKKKEAKMQKKPLRQKKTKEPNSVAPTGSTGNHPVQSIVHETAGPSLGINIEETARTKPTAIAASILTATAPQPSPIHNNEVLRAKIDIPKPGGGDPMKGYRIPVRTKVSMTELLNRMGCRSPAGSPAALKNSKRVLGKIAPLHPTRRTPPPQPPRVARVEKKTKAQRDEEALWDEEWEEQLGDAWYEMTSEDKERMRRERRDQLWVED